jgi:hypothetical protein
MMRRLRRFLALSPTQRRLFVGAWLALPVIDLMLRVLGLQRTERILARGSALPSVPRTPTPSEADIAAADADAALVAIAGRYALGNGSCLRQALFMWWRLRRRGLRPEIRIGVTLQDGFAAHAWVELDGRPLAQPPEQHGRFVPMEVFARELPRRA